jgi:general secretion pathway protein G
MGTRRTWRRRRIAVIAACLALLTANLILAVRFVRVAGSTETALVHKARADLECIAQASRLFRSDHGRWPTSVTELESVSLLPDGSRSGPYLAGPALDPWTGVPYAMRTGGFGRIELTSLGADGAPGGEGLDSDVVILAAPGP